MYLPKKFLFNLLGGLLKIISYLTPEARKIAEIQMKFALRDKNINYNKLVDNNFSHLGKAIAEVFFIKKLLAKNDQNEFLYIDSSSNEIVNSLLKNKQSALALSGHFGCFELLAAYYIAYGLPVSVVARKPNYKALDYFITDVRKSYGVETYWREDTTAAKKILSSFHSGKIVAALIDQDTALENAFSPFFDMPAASPIALIRLAIKKEVEIISTFIVRKDFFRHQIIAKKIPYNKEDPEVEVKILSVFNKHLESLILQYPEQWIWWHRRWRRKPDIDYKNNPHLLANTNNYLHTLKMETKWKN